MEIFEVIVYTFAIYGFIRFIVELFYFHFGKKHEKQISYISLSSEEVEEAQEALRNLLYKMYWHNEQYDHGILLMSIKGDKRTKEILEILQKQYPEVKVIEDSI